MDQGDCPAITKDAWVFKLDKPFDKSQDKALVKNGQSQLTENLYQKASASPTVFKGTVYYPSINHLLVHLALLVTRMYVLQTMNVD